ncbi:hypothetical protein NQZ68_035333 [Dissostichus eleginoides]|nr:hypothetical protein NQZ68_035333 [Dissostichus eleginoides]
MLQTASANSVGAIQLLSVVVTADHALSSVLNSGKISADSFQKTFFEWEAVRFEVENICKEESFICPACTPDMLAVSVDGNRKHYRFKHAARSEEKATFEGVFIAKDEEVTRFVDYIHTTTKHVSGRGVCGGEWSAARETSQRSTSKVEEEGLKLATTKALQNQLQNLETMKVQMAVTESKLEDWVNDVKEWAEAAKTTTTSNDADALASRIELLVASIKRRSQRLYKGTDCSKGRARIRRRIRTEKGILTSVVESYNRMVVSTETILSGETKTERPRDKESGSSHRSSILLSSSSSLV